MNAFKLEQQVFKLLEKRIVRFAFLRGRGTP